MKNRLIVITALAIILLVVSVVYLPGLQGPFVLDDLEHISRDPSIAVHNIDLEHIRKILNVGTLASLNRPLATLTFALNYSWADGVETTWYYKITNLIIHATNAILIYSVVFLLLSTSRLRETLTQSERQVVALIGTALWAIHPIQLTNVLYVVQRMNSLSTLFVLTALILFLLGRRRLSTSPIMALSLMSVGTVGGMALGLTAKENAALIPLYLGVVEYTLFSRDDLTQRTRHYLYVFYALSLALPVALFATYIAAHPEFITNEYATRRFTVYERLLTETRILWYYVSLLLIPSTKRLSLFHDDITLSHGLFDPFSTFIAASGIAIVLVFSLLKAKRFPVATFAILWFLAGHSMESTILDLELAYEHRNYLPSLGPFLAVSYGLILLTKIGSSKKLSWYVLTAALVGILGISTWVRANSWKDLYTFAVTEAEHHPDSERANDFAARVSFKVRQDIGESLRYTLRGQKAAPGEVGFLIDLQILLAILPTQPHPTVAVPSIPPELTDPETIARLLREKSISVHGVVSFENLRKCIVDAPYACRSLRDKAILWFSIAADESHTSKDYQGIIAADAARLFADAGDYDRAYQYVKRATAEFPHLMSYKIGLAEYTLKLGCPAQAKPLIEQIEQMAQQNPPNPINRASLTRLKEMYDISVRRSGSSAHGSEDLCYKMDK